MYLGKSRLGGEEEHYEQEEAGRTKMAVGCDVMGDTVATTHQ